MALQACFLDVLIELGEGSAAATGRRHGRVVDRAAELLVAGMRVLPDLATIARELGVSVPGQRAAPARRPGSGVLTGRAWTGLVQWVGAHPRTAKRMSRCDAYLPGCYDRARMVQDEPAA